MSLFHTFDRSVKRKENLFSYDRGPWSSGCVSWLRMKKRKLVSSNSLNCYLTYSMKSYGHSEKDYWVDG